MQALAELWAVLTLPYICKQVLEQAKAVRGPSLSRPLLDLCRRELGSGMKRKQIIFKKKKKKFFHIFIGYWMSRTINFSHLSKLVINNAMQLDHSGEFFLGNWLVASVKYFLSENSNAMYKCWFNRMALEFKHIRCN